MRNHERQEKLKIASETGLWEEEDWNHERHERHENGAHKGLTGEFGTTKDTKDTKDTKMARTIGRLER